MRSRPIFLKKFGHMQFSRPRKSRKPVYDAPDSCRNIIKQKLTGGSCDERYVMRTNDQERNLNVGRSPTVYTFKPQQHLQY